MVKQGQKVIQEFKEFKVRLAQRVKRVTLVFQVKLAHKE
jgi:hypothetical protein